MTIRTLGKKGLSQRAIARTLEVSRNTVRRYISEDDLPRYHRTAPYLSILDSYKDHLTERLKEYPKLTADRLYRELVKKGYTGSYETVAIFVRNHRPDNDPQAYERFETPPGKQAQVDWGECEEKLDHFGVKRKVYLFSMTLGFSRTQYIEFTLDMKLPALLHCILNAFRYFDGIPEEMLFDNMKTVVEEHIGDKVRFNERFLDFANHYGFEPKATRVCYPEGKGKVERSIQYVWTSFYTGRKFDSLAQMNNEGRSWLDNVCNVRIHGTTGARPVDRLEEEHSRLQPIPKEDYDICEVVLRKVHKDCYFSYKQNYYSVPHEYIRQTVQIKVYTEKLVVLDKDKVIASHRLCPLRNQFIKDPDHFKGIVRRQRGAIERYQQQFSRYGDYGKRFIHSAIEECQPNPYYHWKRILELAEDYPENMVQIALRQCLEFKAFSFATFRNVIVRLPDHRHQSRSMKMTVCGRCREDLPGDVTRPLAYYETTMPLNN